MRAERARVPVWTAAAVAIATLLASLWAPLLLGHDAVPWDGSSQFAPAFALVGEAAREGELRLWDPWVAGGWPLAADPQFGAFSPLVLAFAALSGGAEWGFRAYLVALWIALGLGWLAVGRRLAAPPGVALAVALALATSGAALSHAEHASWLASYALLPWILERALAARSGGGREALEAGALWGLQALAGYPSIVLGTALVVPLAWLAAPAGGLAAAARATLGRRALAVLAGGAVALVVALPALLALLGEASGFSDRAQPLDVATLLHDNAYPPGAAVSFASPYLAVLALVPGSPWRGVDPSLVSLWFGVVPPLLLVATLALRRPSPRLVALLIAAGALFVLALPASPLRAALAEAVPPTRYFRHGAMFKDLGVFAVALATLAGARAAAGAAPAPGPGRRWRVGVALGALAAGAALLTLASLAAAPAQARRVPAAMVHAPLAWGLGALVVGGWTVGAVERRQRWTSALIALALADAGAAVTLARPLAVDSGATRRRWDRLADERRTGSDLLRLGFARERTSAWSEDPGGRGNENAVVKQPTWNGYLALANGRHLELVASGAVDALVLGEQRVWFAPHAARAPASDASAALWHATLGLGRLPTLVVHPRAGMSGAIGASAAPAPSTWTDLSPLRPLNQRLETFLPERLELSFTAPEAGWVLIAERWAAGWQASLDGRPVALDAGNFLFRALEVGAGEHHLAMVYRPAGYPWALAGSWGLLAAVAAVAVRSHRP